MSVLSYLTARASESLLSGLGKHSIERSTELLTQRIKRHFAQDVQAQIQFGSSTRGTILPRSMDEKSDIDYMIVFKDNGYAPQTYLDRLKRFVNENYSRHAIYQSSPTIVLELNHIKFDLVPAIHTWWSGIRIPNGRGGWVDTDIAAFNTQLTSRNAECGQLLKPAIRLVKYWNSQNGYPFESFLLEKWIVEQYYPFCTNLKDYVFKILERLHLHHGSVPSNIPLFKRVLKTIEEIKQDEKINPKLAESKIRILIP